MTREIEQVAKAMWEGQRRRHPKSLLNKPWSKLSKVSRKYHLELAHDAVQALAPVGI
jgi:hypothetical protein